MATTETYDLLKQAILKREQVVAIYEGEERRFCPHALGFKHRRRHVLGYQFGGASRSGLPPRGEWRCFDVDRLAEVATRPGPWYTAPNVFNPQSCLDTIDVTVQPAPPLAVEAAELGETPEISG
ncbi:MAG TPA: WYL domain-containing protein [Thermomicrobiales bacterium]|nr:WYL domain-containing protein [Thermomicrobiales bacterium]